MTRASFIRTLSHLRATTTRPPELTDDELLAQFLHRRDGEAFAALVRRHGPLVWGACRRALATPQDAEDAFQTTFLALVRKAARLGNRRSLAGWLYAAAGHAAAKARRSAARRHFHETAAPACPTPSDPLAELTARELCQALDEELSRLPERYRLPLLLCALEGLSRDETAARLGWSVGSVKGRLERGRELLRQRLEKRGLTLPAAMAGALAAGQAMSPALLADTVRAAGLVVPAARMGLPTLLALAVLGLAGVAVGVGGRSSVAPEPPTPAARLDRFGDPLPDGAITRLGTLRFRHGRVQTLAFSEDGRSILTAGHDGVIRFWDPTTGQQTHEQQLPGTTPSVVALSPDGRMLAYQNDFTALRLWDVTRGRPGHALQIGGDIGWFEIAFTPDGRTMAASGPRGQVRLFDVATGQGRLLDRRSRFSVVGLVFSPDSRRLITWGNGPMNYWDTATGQETHSFRSPASAWRMAPSPDGRSLFAVSDGQRQVMVWDAATAELVKVWPAPEAGRVQSLCFTPDGRALVLSLEDRLLFWDPATGRELRSLPGRTTRQPTFSPDGTLLAAFGKHTLQRWDLATGRPLPVAESAHGHQGEVDAVAFAPDSRTVATSSYDHDTVRLWDAATGAPTGIFTVPNLSFHNLAFSPDGRELYVGASAGVHVFDVVGRREVRQFLLTDGGGEPPQHLMSMGLSADGKSLMAYCQVLDRQKARRVSVWDTATGLRRLSRPHEPPDDSCPPFAADGRFLVRGGWVEDVTTGRRLATYRYKYFSACTPAVSPDGRLVAMALEEAKQSGNRHWTEPLGLDVWEVLTGQQVLHLPVWEVARLAFSPDSRLLAVGGVDAVGLWEVPAGREVHRLPAPGRMCGSFGPSFASCLAFSPDGRRLVTGHIDTTALVWELPPQPHRQAGPLSPDHLDTLWGNLTADATRAYTAIAALAADPPRALPLLRERLRPAEPVPVGRLRELIADLDSPGAAARDRAARELADLGERAEPALRAALAANPSAEARRRLERLLSATPPAPDPEALRRLRAVAVLERINSSEARDLLARLATGDPAARLTREAGNALDRLGRAGRP